MSSAVVLMTAASRSVSALMVAAVECRKSNSPGGFGRCFTLTWWWVPSSDRFNWEKNPSMALDEYFDWRPCARTSRPCGSSQRAG